MNAEERPEDLYELLASHVAAGTVLNEQILGWQFSSSTRQNLQQKYLITDNK